MVLSRNSQNILYENVAKVCFQKSNIVILQAVVEMGLYAPIRNAGTKFLCLYTYKKCIDTLVTQHLYLYRDSAHQSELDERNLIAVVLSTNIQNVFSQKYTLN